MYYLLYLFESKILVKIVLENNISWMFRIAITLR